MSRAATMWGRFSAKVTNHIETYVVPQYGDDGSDLAAEYTASDCVKQMQRYIRRFDTNSRPGEQKRDLLKIAHWAQKAHDKLEP